MKPERPIARQEKGLQDYHTERINRRREEGAKKGEGEEDDRVRLPSHPASSRVRSKGGYIE